MPFHFPSSPQLTSLPSLQFAGETRHIAYLKRYQNFKDDPSLRTLLELLFKIEERGSTVQQEIYCGALGFLSVASILAINPSLLVVAGYDKHDVTSATALFAGLACIATGMLSNLPFIMMPVLGTSIYMSVYMAQYGLTVGQGNVAVFMLGVVLTVCSLRPIALLLSKIIPKSTNAGIFIGVGLLCALEGLSRVGLVKRTDREGGTLMLGDIWAPEACITLCCYLITGTLLHKKFKAAVMIGMLMGSVMFWGYMGTWPAAIFSTLTLAFNCDFSETQAIAPSAANNFTGTEASYWPVVKLTIDLFFIVIVLFSGLTTGMSHCAGLTREDGSTPRSRWLFFACGAGTMLGAFCGSGPVLLSGESIIGIQAGARSGLSTIVCGVLFLLSTLMSSFWASIPDTGIAPVLLIVGFLFFDGTAAVDWKNTKEALPTFTTAIMTAFTCSVLNGAVIGTLMHVLLAITTDYADNLIETIVKGFFRSWNWVKLCWHRTEGDDNDFCGVGEVEACVAAGEARRGYHAVRQAGEEAPSTAEDSTPNSGTCVTADESHCIGKKPQGEKYYQGSV